MHIDIDPAEISKNVPAHIPIVGDSKRILPKLTAEYRALEADRSRMDDWWAQLRKWQDEYPLKFEGSKDGDIPPQRMIQALYEVTGGNAILTSDVGQHQMWTAQHYHFPAPRRWINSGGLGTMGFGLPSAIGAKVAKPDELVVCVAGDGSLVMTCQELATAVEHDIDVKVFIMNNGYLGMVRQWQELFWDKRYSSVDDGLEPGLGEARRGVRRARHARRRGQRGRGRDARGDRDRGPRGARRARAPGGELLPDDPRRRCRAGHGGLIHG